MTGEHEQEQATGGNPAGADEQDPGTGKASQTPAINDEEQHKAQTAHDAPADDANKP